MSFLPEECEDTGAWEAHDWSGHCTKLAENKLEGYCSAAVCACREQGGCKAGDACDLSCPMGADFSPCSEASFGGTCAYPRTNERPRTLYADPANNKISNQQLFEIECMCRHRDAMPEDGCRVDCSRRRAGVQPRSTLRTTTLFRSPRRSRRRRVPLQHTRQTLVNVTSWKERPPRYCSSGD